MREKPVNKVMRQTHMIMYFSVLLGIDEILAVFYRFSLLVSNGLSA